MFFPYYFRLKLQSSSIRFFLQKNINKYIFYKHITFTRDSYFMSYQCLISHHPRNKLPPTVVEIGYLSQKEIKLPIEYKVYTYIYCVCVNFVTQIDKNVCNDSGKKWKKNQYGRKSPLYAFFIILEKSKYIFLQIYFIYNRNLFHVLSVFYVSLLLTKCLQQCLRASLFIIEIKITPN